jgi:anti-anti-sigma factor
VYDIEVRQDGAVTLVRLYGEFDLFALGELRETFDALASLPGRILADLAEVTFLDLLSVRELAARSQLEGRRLVFRTPSPEAAASIEAARLGTWIRFHPDPDRNGPQLFTGVS